MKADPSRESTDALKTLARALAPHIAEELRRLDRLENELDADFDDATCRRFVDKLGTGVLERARALFELLNQNQVVDSVGLAQALAITPRELSGYLTTPLKRRAAALELPLPFAGGQGSEPYGGIPGASKDMDPQRTHWQDRSAIAQRMLSAIDTELTARMDREAAGTRA